jgi:hypothetical protein
MKGPSLGLGKSVHNRPPRFERVPISFEELFAKALDFAQNLTIIKEEERNILQHARNSLLFSHDGETWQKKNGLFDVTMG